MEEKDIISSGILELYVLGITSEEEKVQVEQWISLYPEVQDELSNIQKAMEDYAMANAIEPSADLKQRIMNNLNFSSDPLIADTSSKTLTPVVNKNYNDQKVHTISSYFKWAAAACFVLLLGSLALNYTYFNRYKSANKDLQLTRSELQNQKELAAAMSKDIDVVTAKDARPVVLYGTPHAPDALAKIFWMKNTGEVYVDPTNLPQPTAGKQYQLWAIVNGKPVNGGMIPLQPGNIKIQKMKSFGKAEAFAITLETVGGSPAPNMDEMYVMAKI